MGSWRGRRMRGSAARQSRGCGECARILQSQHSAEERARSRLDRAVSDGGQGTGLSLSCSAHASAGIRRIPISRSHTFEAFPRIGKLRTQRPAGPARPGASTSTRK